MEYITVSARTLDDAITEALVQLGVTSDQLDYWNRDPDLIVVPLKPPRLLLYIFGSSIVNTISLFYKTNLTSLP